jgi:hypothetical protein
MPILLLEITKMSDREAQTKPFNDDYVDDSDMAEADDDAREEMNANEEDRFFEKEEDGWSRSISVEKMKLSWTLPDFFIGGSLVNVTARKIDFSSNAIFPMLVKLT